MSFFKNYFLKLVESAVNNGVSDIHIRMDEKPCFRIKGDLIPVKTAEYTKENIIELLEVFSHRAYEESELESLKELDGSYEVKDLCRVRFNFLKYQSKVGIILRLISTVVPTIETLGLSEVIRDISQASHGLILVTGATGSGKTSTLAAMIHEMNKTRAAHILTLEDPVEYLHQSIKSRVTQREIGDDTDDFEVALRSALRQDPDVILIGEMRDAQTISTALKAAETGHLVLGTVHTTNALSTVGRLISMFPPNEQKNARDRLANNLHATISQRLLKTIDGQGRVAAQEIMIVTPGIVDSIKKPEKTEEIYTYISKGNDGYSSQTFDQHITKLFKDGLISMEEAKANATSPEDFERNLLFGDESKKI